MGREATRAAEVALLDATARAQEAEDECAALRAEIARAEGERDKALRDQAWHRAEYERIRQAWRAAESRNEVLTAQVRDLERRVERRTAAAFALEAERDAARAALVEEAARRLYAEARFAGTAAICGTEDWETASDALRAQYRERAGAATEHGRG